MDPDSWVSKTAVGAIWSTDRSLAVLHSALLCYACAPHALRVCSACAPLDTRQRAVQWMGVQWMAFTGGATSRTRCPTGLHNQCQSDSGNPNQHRKRLHLVSTTPPFAECRSACAPRALRGCPAMLRGEAASRAFKRGGGYCRLRHCCLESLDRELFVQVQ